MRMRTWFVLLLCLLACGGCSKEKSTGQLIEDLKSSSSKEGDRITAVRLLPRRMGDAAQVVPVLIEALKDNDGDIRWSAAIGLGTLGEKAKEAIPALQEARSDRDARVRNAVRVALSRIDPTDFPAGSPAKEGQGK
jgi:HEAT repeats